IGLYAFCFCWVFQATDRLFVAARSQLIDYPAPLLVWEAGVSVGLLFFPTVFMGGTLPLLAAWVEEQLSDAGRGAAGFYSINSLGAVCGAFLAGFFLIRILGLVSSLQMTALVNVLIGFTAIGLSKKGFDEVAAESAAVASRGNRGANEAEADEEAPSPP